MWRALLAALFLATLGAACSSNGTEEPLPTFSPSYWATQVCNSPGSIELVLLDPQADPRFQAQSEVSGDGDPQDVVAGRIDLNIRNLHNLADYLEGERAPDAVAEFHQALIDDARALANAVEGARDDILAAESPDEMQTIYDGLLAENDQRLETLETTARTTLTPDVVDQIGERAGCWEHLGIGPLGTSASETQD